MAKNIWVSTVSYMLSTIEKALFNSTLCSSYWKCITNENMLGYLSVEQMWSISRSYLLVPI